MKDQTAIAERLPQILAILEGIKIYQQKKEVNDESDASKTDVKSRKNMIIQNKSH